HVTCLLAGAGSAEDTMGGKSAAVFGASLAVVSTIDLSQVATIMDRGCEMPGIEPLLGGGQSAKTALQNIVTTGTPGDALGFEDIASSTLNRCDLLMFRFQVEVRQNTSGTFTLRVQQNKQAGGTGEADYQSTTSTSLTTLDGPWIPVQGWPDTSDWSI